MFYEKYVKSTYDPKSVVAFATEIANSSDAIASRQAIKVGQSAGLVWDKKTASFDLPEDEHDIISIQWIELKNRLWEIKNASIDKKLRGI